MRMRIDEARQYRKTRQIDHPCPGRHGEVLGERIDDPVPDEDAARPDERAMLAVEDAPGVDESDTGICV